MNEPTSDTTRSLTKEELAAIEEKYDEGAATRSVTPGFS